MTQLIMSAVLIAVAATIVLSHPRAQLGSVQEIASALTAVFGDQFGLVVFAAGMACAALVAIIVVCLTLAWGVGEVAGFKRSVEHHPHEAPWFYGIFSVSLVAGGVLVASGVNLVQLSVAVEVLSALQLQIVLGFLYVLALKALPDLYQLIGAYRYAVGVVIVVTAGFGFYAGRAGAFSGS